MVDVPFARVRLETTGSEVVGFGGGSIDLRFYATLAVEVWWNVEVGAGNVLSIADDLKAAIVNDAAVNYEGHSYRRLGRADAGAGNAVRPLWGVQFEVRFSFVVSISPPPKSGVAENDFTSVAAAVQSMFQSLAATEGVTIQRDNTTWPDPSFDQLWCRLEIEQGTAAGGVTFGGNVANWRRNGNMQVLIYSPNEFGSGEAWRFVDAIVRTFACTSHGGAVFDVPTASVLGRDGRWWVTGVDSRFTVDEVR